MKSKYILTLLAAIMAIAPAAVAQDTITAPCTIAEYTGMSTALLYRNYTLIGGMPDMEDMGFPLSTSVYKFDISGFTEPVESAYLQVEKVTSNMASITAANTLEVTAVALDSDVANWSVLDASAYGETLSTVTFGANGLYSFDVTNLVNSWIAGADNNGLALITSADGFVSDDAMGYVTLAGIDGSSYGSPAGIAPAIVATVPEPASMALLGCGALILRRKRKA